MKNKELNEFMNNLMMDEKEFNIRLTPKTLKMIETLTKNNKIDIQDIIEQYVEGIYNRLY